jgi:hypothetical protein
MRLTLDFTRNANGQFEGTAEVEANRSVEFCGTLELLRVLEVVSQNLGSGPLTEA